MTGDVGEGGGEDCCLGVCVFGFVGLFGGVVVGVVGSFVVEVLLVLAALVLMSWLTGDGGGGRWEEGLGLGGVGG